MRVCQAKAEDIYDEVDDHDYRSVVRGRLMEQDFVEDDGNGAEGYVDNGEEHWDRSASEGEEEEGELDFLYHVSRTSGGDGEDASKVGWIRRVA